MVIKRLVRYVLLFKRTLLMALCMLTFAVGAELMGPYVAKILIDDHIMVVQKPWYETTNRDEAVSYKGKFYVQADEATAREKAQEPSSIVQVGRTFYWSEMKVASGGERSVRNGELRVTEGNVTNIYPVERMTKEQLMKFYSPEIKPIIQLLAMYFGLLVIAGFLEYGQHFLLQTMSNRIIQKMREDVFAHIQRLPIRYFDNLPAGKVVSRVTNDTEAIRELFVTVLANFFKGAINIVGIYVALFILDAKLAAIALLLLPILAVWIYVYRKYASTYNHKMRSVLSDINGMINESIQGMKIVQAFRREEKTMEEFEAMNETHFSYRNKLLNLNSITGHNLSGLIRNIAFVAFIYYFGGESLAKAAITVGLLYAFVDYLNRLFHPITDIVNQLANLEQSLVSAERVFELLDEQGVDVDDNRIERYRGNVTFDNVSFAYNDDDYVLKNISFTAREGETVALVGHTGSGKSSIMNLLLQYYDYQKGNIYIDGMEMRDYSKQALRDHMAIVLQDPYLFTGTIASNISLDDPRVTREAVEKALRDVGGEEIFKHLKNGLDEEVKEKGSTLSSGQRQLISFARALAFNPAILVLDEATANIDTETEEIIQTALNIVKQGRTTFVIAHRLSTIKNADQILVLDKGQIVERGSHDELMALGKKYYQMYKTQMGKSA